MQLTRHTLRIPVSLMALAREKVGPEPPDAEVVRIALARLAGVDPANYPVKRGPDRKVRRAA